MAHTAAWCCNDHFMPRRLVGSHGQAMDIPIGADLPQVGTSVGDDRVHLLRASC
jgi:hypothetical protein